MQKSLVQRLAGKALGLPVKQVADCYRWSTGKEAHVVIIQLRNVLPSTQHLQSQSMWSAVGLTEAQHTRDKRRLQSRMTDPLSPGCKVTVVPFETC